MIEEFVTEMQMPDYIAAIVAYLRDQPVVTDLCPPQNIAPRMPVLLDDNGGTVPPKNFITVGGVPGFQHRDLPILMPRFYLRTFGSTGFNAMNLWRACHSALAPSDPSRHINGFERVGCRVYDIAIVNTPITMVEEGWESRYTIYRALVLEQMVD